MVVGFIIGHFKLLPKENKITQRVVLFGLIFLLVVMGAQLGANKELLADFGRMGVQASALAAGGIFFSILLVRMVEGYIRRGLTENKQLNRQKKAGERN
nr:LysO family transporter [Desulforadius tongensis]